MTAAFDGARAAAHEQRRQRAMRMAVAVADAAAEKNDRMVEQRSIAILRRSQLLEVLGEQLEVISLNDGALVHLHRIVLMMRQRMMRLRNPDLRIRTSGLFASVHERNHAREVGL